MCRRQVRRSCRSPRLRTATATASRSETTSGSVESATGAAPTARVINRSEASLALRADSVANWSISRSWRTRMEKLLLTVREAADVLSVSRSRVYELIYAEQLDSVKLGRSRRVSLASVRRLAEGQSVS